jgi:hypothetical protein
MLLQSYANHANCMRVCQNLTDCQTFTAEMGSICEQYKLNFAGFFCPLWVILFNTAMFGFRTETETKVGRFRLRSSVLHYCLCFWASCLHPHGRPLLPTGLYSYQPRRLQFRLLLLWNVKSYQNKNWHVSGSHNLNISKHSSEIRKPLGVKKDFDLVQSHGLFVIVLPWRLFHYRTESR